MAPPRERRPGYSRRAQYGLLATYVLTIAGAVVGAALLVLSSVNPSAFAAVRMTVASVTAPVSSVMATGARGIAAVPAAAATWWNVHGENAELRDELARLRPKVVEAQLAALENRRLRALLGVRDIAPRTIATARIVSSSGSSTRRYGVLNAGAWQGVREGMPVRGPEGLIGRVLEVGPASARVLLLTDPESIVPIRRTRDGLPALAFGRGDGLVDLRSAYSADGRFRPGDLFVTSGSGGIYPPGLLVARAVRGGAERVPARPLADPNIFDFAVVMPAYLSEQPQTGRRVMPAAPLLPAPTATTAAPSPSAISPTPAATGAPAATPTPAASPTRAPAR